MFDLGIEMLIYNLLSIESLKQLICSYSLMIHVYYVVFIDYICYNVFNVDLQIIIKQTDI